MESARLQNFSSRKFVVVFLSKALNGIFPIFTRQTGNKNCRPDRITAILKSCVTLVFCACVRKSRFYVIFLAFRKLRRADLTYVYYYTLALDVK